MAAMRALTFLVCIGSLTAACSASYELILVSDQGSDSVRRFDPYSGAAFGSFGAGYLVDPKGVAVDRTSGEAVVLDGPSGQRLSYWDYSTGVLKRAEYVAPGASFLNQNPDRTINLTYANRVARHQFSGGLMQNYGGAAGIQVSHGMLQGDGLFYVAQRNGDTTTLAYRWHNAATGALIGETGWFADRTVAGPGNVSFNVFKVPGLNRLQLERDVVNSGPVGFTPLSLDGYTAVSAVAIGHWPIGYATIRTTGGVWEISRVDVQGAFALAPFAVGGMIDPTGMAIVVAPEPASLAALGIGLIALARRRMRARP